jgi:GDPmannose 4,6-dehydratase
MQPNLIRPLKTTPPTEIHNLATQSHVHISFGVSEFTGNADGFGTLRLFKTLRVLNLTRKTPFYRALTSEMHSSTTREVFGGGTALFMPRRTEGV